MVEHARATDLSADRLRALIARVKEKGVPEAPIRPRRDREGPLPLSLAQERLWVLDRLGEGSAAQAVVSHLRLAGRLAPAALARTLAELVRRHETLRTTFGERGGVPFQEIAPAAGLPIDLPLPAVDLAGLPAPARDREMLRLAGEEARRPFDLARGPLLRNLLLRLGPEDHVLATTMHRAVSDAGSMAVLTGEMVSLYAAFSAGLPSPLPEPALQYADFALWQRERLEDQRIASELAWWSERLAGLEPLELLPTDRPRPPVQSFRGARRRLALSPATAAGLRELGQREGAAPLMVLLTLWQVLLSRWSAQTDFAVGLEAAHRDRREVQGLIGPLAGTLPLRAGLAGRPGFRELLGRARQAVEEARAHEVPFEKLVDSLQPERLRDRHPLFQVGCALRDPEPEMRAGELQGTPLDLDSGVARLDLDLTWSEREGGFEGTLEHSADLFDGATVQRLLRHHLALVRAVLDDPERWVEELPLLSAAERAEALAAGAGPAGPGPAGDGVLHALFEEQAALRPDAVAVESEDGSLTYAELDARANQLARTLRRLGAGPDAVVGFHVPRSLEMIIGLLGIFKAGAAYVPLDSSSPRERMEAMIGDCRPVALLTLAAVQGELPEGSLPMIRVDADRALLDRESPASLDPAATADNLAFVLYTSGSTGRPKGVMVPHRGLLNRFLHARAFSRLGPRDAMLHKAPLAFDFALWEAIGALTAGGRAVLARPGGHVDFPYLARLLDERRITLFHLVPSLLDAFLADPQTAGCGSALRQAYTGGEAVTPALRDRFFARFPRVPLDNQYGPTEASIDITWQPMRPDGPRPPVTPIGFPHPHCAAHVLAPSLEPLPVGVPGEICLGGVALARGYLGRPDLTAERFVPDPSGNLPGGGGRLYRTGDLARRLPGGAIEYLGRIDHQVKIRGVRIEPGEIEAALLRHPRLREAAVVVHEGPSLARGTRLVACFVAEEPAPDSSELRALLARTLPETMLPAAFVALPALPRLASDKIDRRALARIEPPAEGPREHVPPRTPVEIQLAAVWSDLLGIERVGANDGFFALGGHSLLAVQLVSRLRDQLGVDIPVRALFEEPTLAGLAGRIESAWGTGSVAPPIPRAAREGLLPPSFAQERLWFLEQLEPGTAFYNIPGASRLTGPLRVGVLQACIAALAGRHESLRTVFGDVQGRPHQEVLPEIRIDVPLVDLAGLPGAAREAELQRRVTEESRRPFDLTQGPLVRAPIFRLGQAEHVLVPTLHHIISDGWSMTVLLRELAAFYEAFSAGRPAALPELPIQYADYAVWQRGYLQGEALAARLAWWRERLAGVPGLQLPTDRRRPAVETFRGRQRPVALSPGLTHRLHELGSREGVTLFMTLLALFQTVLLRATGQTDLPVGSPIANRPRSETEGVIGFFANTVVLRTDLSGDPTFRELLRRVREVTVGAYAHEDLPFEKLVEELQPERDMSRNPLFQVMCVLQNQPWPAFRMGDVELAGLPVDTGTAKFDLTLFWREEEGALNGILEHNSDLFDDTTARRLFHCFETLLAAALDDPAARIGALPLLGEAERHHLLREWSGAAGNRSGHQTAARCVHRWVEEQVARTPGAPAVVDGGRTLTYAELDERANRLARGLARRGVRPEALVGICVERSLEMVVAALAVLKAGGALVALDPAYPRERLATIIDDASLAVLLTQESLLQHFPQHAGIALLLEKGSDPFPDESADNPGVEVDLDHPIYAIYTSGSTGQPKGILVTHRAFASLLAWQLGDPGLRPGARTVQLSTFGFCVSFQEMFSSWCSGGVLVVADEMTRRDLGGLAGFLEEQEIDRLHLPFAALKHLAEAVATEAPDRRRLPARLHAVITAGEQLQVTPAVRALFDLLPACTLSNQYGASETHVVSALTLSGDPSAWPAIPPVGRPVENVCIHLLDAELAPVPIGVAGELFAGGACLPRGYLNDPVLTAQKLVPDPYSSVPGARLYRTGDAARHLADGRIEYHGRIDTQVKIRGFRVELGEIETVLARHAGVRDAAVVARDGHDGKRLFAYVVPAAAETADALFEELRAHLKQRLPEHMLPSAFVALPVLPVNANGKLDQAVLPEPEIATPDEDYVAPRTPAEELIAGIWAEVLGLERVGVCSDFFDLGGHSLLATQVVARVRQALGVELGVRALFEARTVAGLALAIAEAPLDPADAAEGRAPMVRVPRGEPLALSFAQQRLWFLDQLEPGNPVYNLPAAVELAGRLDVPALAAAFSEVVRRHEALRTTFSAAAGEPAQVVAEPAAFALPLVDLQGLPWPEDIEEESRRLAAAEARRPFDLGDPKGGPLLRATLLQVGAERHTILLTMHHIASDGWSLGVLVREIGALYAAFAAGRPSPLPELPVQYADFAAWQRRRLSGERLEAELAWWRGRLAGMPPALNLPTDHPRQAASGGRGALLVFSIDREGSAGLTSLSRRHGATLFMTLLAGFAGLLGRHAGQDDLAVGTPVAGRTRVEAEPLIGFFVNTLVLRADLSGDPSFGELLERVREATLAAFSHQEVPFERLVEELAPERKLSRLPLVQVLFALQNAPSAPLELPGLTLTASGLETGMARLELSFTLTETERGLAGTFEYSRDLFERPTIERLSGHFARLLAAAVADPRRRLAELPLLSEPERAQILVEWRGEGTAYPREATIHALFAEQAALRPDALAVVGAGGTGELLTYGELRRRAGHQARRLRALGVGPEVRVGIYLDRSPVQIVATLAVLIAGGAYVPLDPSHPPERLAYLMSDSAATVLVTEERWLAALPRTGAAVLCMDREEAWEAAGPPSPSAEAPEVPAPALAYVMYTSGSTGQPKGVAVPHRAVIRLVAGTDYVRIGAGDRLGHLSNTAFDASTFEVWGALLCGGTVVVIKRDVALSPQSLAVELHEQGITTAFLTTALFQQVVREEPGAFAPLRDVLYGGEVCDPDLIRRALAAGPERLLHVYGPTEGTTFTTWHRVESVPGGAATVPLGRPIANTRVHVLDRDLAPVPVGVVGELFAGGDGLARGYLGRPEQTAERFIPDPWEWGERLYRTGDLVRYLPDGRIDFIGRFDMQVKIRGFRIEPAEIEAALLAHGGVREAVVSARPGRDGQRLVAWVVAVNGDAGSLLADLRAHLKQRLPEHMIPSAFVEMLSLPLNANGKLDRSALPEPEPSHAREEYVAPRTPIEELIAGIWAEVLGLERVGVVSDFFELGGHSLLATRVATRVHQALSVNLGVRALFEARTVAGLTLAVAEALLKQAGAGDAAGGHAPIVRVSRGEPLALSFAQQRLWFLDQLEPGNPVYNLPAAIELTGQLDVPALAAAFGEVVRRHEALRTTFSAAGEPAQVVAEPAAFALPLVDLQGLPRPEDIEEENRRLAAAEARRPFDLGNPRGGPLLRATLLQAGAERHTILLTMHHIASDGWSLGVLVREIGALYAAFAAGRPNPLPELPLQYADFAAWQRRRLSGERLEAELTWWRGRLAGMPPALDLPTDHPRQAGPGGRGARHDFSMDREDRAGLTALSRRQGATLFMTLLAGFAGLLGRHAGQDDLAVGVPVAGRTRVETEPLIGFFVNTLVMRVDLSGDPSFGELLGRVREATLAAFSHQEVPFERLVEELAPQRELSRLPLVQVLFALQNAPSAPLELSGLTLTASALDAGMARLELSFTLTETERGLEGMFEYSRDLFERPTIERLSGHFARLLTAAVADPRRRLAELPLLSGPERAQVLVEWRGETTAYPRETPLHVLFAEQAALRPDAVAVVGAGAAGESLTYGELQRRAGLQARRLRAAGVGPEVRVGVCLDRSPERVVATLAVLEAGGAYVPLDPLYPRERLAWLLGDSAVRVLVTEERWLAALPPTDAAVLCVDREAVGEEPALKPIEPLEVPASALAYVMYTSGSTGEPKGVAVPHRGVVRLVRETSYARLGPDEVYLQIAPYSFDASTPEMWGALLNGGRLVMPPPGVLSPADLGDLIAEHGVTILWLTAGLFHQMVEENLPGLKGVGQLLAGGDVVSAPHVRRVLAQLPDMRLSNCYGPTENTTFTSTWPVADPESLGASVPLGRPIANTRVHVLDRELAPVPVGVAGELFTGGDGLARGYLGRPEWTAERFVPDPFADRTDRSGDRLYRTGDLVRYLPDGRLDFLGRFDAQIKIRGFRIEPAEIEAALLAHGGVREAAVLARPGRDGQRLVAWVVAENGEAGSLFADLRTSLKQRLPEHMIPSAFVEMPFLPVNANGKLDRSALPDPEPPHAREEYVAPRTPIEELIAGIWAEVLGLERVGVLSDFFELGGHSLLATRVATRVRQALGVNLGVRALFEARTVAGLTLAVAEALLGQANADAALEAFAEAGAASSEVMRG